jgi:hypothetical protein
MIYRPAANPVPIASPLAEEWLVGQGDTLNWSTITTSLRRSATLLTFSRRVKGAPTNRAAPR